MNPALKTASRKSNPEKRAASYWFLCALGIILILGALFFSLRGFQNLLENRAYHDLTSEVNRKARRVARWQNDLISSLNILAEQKGLRDGVMMMNSGQASRDYREAFLESVEIICRMFPVLQPAVENLTLRNLDGEKWAGQGRQMDSSAVLFPEIRMRYRHLRQEGPLGRMWERWIVPVRGVQAQPLAFLVADGDPAKTHHMFMEEDSLIPDLVCLDDTSGARLWDSSDSLRIPGALGDAQTFLIGKQEYWVAYASVPGSSWIVCQARPGNLIEGDLAGIRRMTVLLAGGSIALFVLITLLLVKRIK